MLKGFHRFVSVQALAVPLVSAVAGCRSAQGAEAPVTTAPSFDSTAKPAEKVTDTSGFQDAKPITDEGVRDTSSQVDKLNAQGVLKRVHFDFDKYDLRTDAIRALGDNAATLKQYPQFKVRIEG